MSPLITKKDIAKYIPQRPPIVMIDSVLSYDSDGIETDFEVKPDNIFLTQGKLSESGMMENIAQSAAARIGYECHLRKVKVPLGFIGGISKVGIFNHPKIGQVVHTKISIEREVMGVTLIKGICYLGAEIMMECEMKIVVASEK